MLVKFVNIIRSLILGASLFFVTAITIMTLVFDALFFKLFAKKDVENEPVIINVEADAVWFEKETKSAP